MAKKRILTVEMSIRVGKDHRLFEVWADERAGKFDRNDMRYYATGSHDLNCDLLVSLLSEIAESYASKRQAVMYVEGKEIRREEGPSGGAV